MYLRKIFQEFLVLHTEAEPATEERSLPPPPPGTEPFDWRWLETVEDAP